jgi:hypothetical protein
MINMSSGGPTRVFHRCCYCRLAVMFDPVVLPLLAQGARIINISSGGPAYLALACWPAGLLVGNPPLVV